MKLGRLRYEEFIRCFALLKRKFEKNPLWLSVTLRLLEKLLCVPNCDCQPNIGAWFVDTVKALSIQASTVVSAFSREENLTW